jgi:beta-lactamase regulating signal transducer with metallopeptidase domain/HEAT repeat protein
MTVRLVGWAIIHSLWQGALIAIVLGISLSTLRKAPAALRHWLCFVALLTFATAPLITSMRYHRSPVTAQAEAVDSDFATSPPLSSATPSTSASPSAAVPEIQSAAQIGAPERFRFEAERWLPWLVVAWLFGVLLLSMRVIGGYVWARRLVSWDTDAVSADIQAMAARIAARLCPHAAVRVLASTRAQVPMVIGMLRPVVLIPASLLTGLTPAQLEAILAHELAHVRRYDYAMNLLQTVFETLFFFHPAMWWLSRRMRDEREQACDELAVAVCGDPYFYSRVLLTVEEWRSARISFAPAATGGSLTRRVQKLIGDDDRKLDVGPRWFAGIVTVAAVLLAGGSAARDQLNAQPPMDASALQDTARAHPASVHKYEGTGALETRVAWAHDVARNKNFGKYWIGYVVAGDVPGSKWDYIDRNTPVRAGDSWISGRMRFDGDFRDIKFSGIALNTLVGDYAPRQHAVMLGFEPGSRPRLVRVRLANFVFPVHFNGWPLVWVQEAGGDESVKLIAGLQNRVADNRVLGDLPTAIGAHVNARNVTPLLVDWSKQTRAPRDLRVGAIEALAFQSSPLALATLAQVARRDRDEDVRMEAVEALEDIPVAAAADTLIAFAESLDTRRLRAEAIEALGQREEPQVVGYLTRVARAGETSLRTDAIEALANLPDQNGMKIVNELARDSKLTGDIRMEAVEALGSHDADNALQTLQEIIFADGDVAVQAKAAESVGNMDDVKAVELLSRIVDTHPQVTVQIEAAEALGNAHPHAPALAALERIARTHAQTSVRARALESLGNFSDDSRGALLLMKLIAQETNEGLQVEGIEALANVGNGTEVVKFLDGLLKSDIGLTAKIEALETLDELPGDVGLPLLRSYARSADRNLRMKAVELLAERAN